MYKKWVIFTVKYTYIYYFHGSGDQILLYPHKKEKTVQPIRFKRLNFSCTFVCVRAVCRAKERKRKKKNSNLVVRRHAIFSKSIPYHDIIIIFVVSYFLALLRVSHILRHRRHSFFFFVSLSSLDRNILRLESRRTRQ